MRKIYWKKGMRITDEILSSHDNCIIDIIKKSALTVTGGRFGLLSTERQFHLDINIVSSEVLIEALDCVALTKDGSLIDINFDTRESYISEYRINIPSDVDNDKYILIINVNSGEWEETDNNYCAPVYSFSLLAQENILPENSFPIARLVYDMGWRIDEEDFVPPCLFISSHYKYGEIQLKFINLLKELNYKIYSQINPSSTQTLKTFYPILQQVLVEQKNETATCTPAKLMSDVQKCVSAFFCGCITDGNINFKQREEYYSYILSQYSYINCYERIKEGLDFCYEINEKLDKLFVQEEKQTILSAPIIEEGIFEISDNSKSPKLKIEMIGEKEFKVYCTFTVTKIPVKNVVKGASLWFAVNSNESYKKSASNEYIEIANGFDIHNIPEKEKRITVNLKAIQNGQESDISTYSMILFKAVNVWGGIWI